DHERGGRAVRSPAAAPLSDTLPGSLGRFDRDVPIRDGEGEATVRAWLTSLRTGAGVAEANSVIRRLLCRISRVLPTGAEAAVDGEGVDEGSRRRRHLRPQVREPRAGRRLRLVSIDRETGRGRGHLTLRAALVVWDLEVDRAARHDRSDRARLRLRRDREVHPIGERPLPTNHLQTPGSG